MRKYFYLCFILLTSQLQAAPGEFHAGVSYLLMQLNYKEPGIMSEKGKLNGVGIDARYDMTENLILGMQGKFLGGELEYNGATFDGTPIKQTTKDKVREYRGLISYNLGNLAPYTGYGYRYWQNDLVISYVRETTYHYIPLGLKYTIDPLYFSYEFRHFLKGVNKSHMSDVDPNRKDVTLKQESGRGYAFEAGYFTRVVALDFKISLSYEYWRIENSKTANDGVDTLIEPHNSTSSFILSAGLFF